jgi:hypothetical protein
VRIIALLAVLVLGADVTTGCLTPMATDCACTQEFDFLIVTVKDASGQPVSGLTITVTEVGTGKVLPVQQDAPTAGTYIILDDSFKSQISSSPETIRVTGQKGSSTFSQDYSVQVDSCGCHVSKVSGPDIITLS